MSVMLQMSSDHERIVAVPAASRRSSSTSKKKKKEKKKKKDVRQASSSTSTSTARSSIIIHEMGGDDEDLPEGFAKEYSLDLDQLGPSSPRSPSESSSESKSDSEDDDRKGRRKKKREKSKPFTRPRVLTSSAEAISAPIVSEEEGGSSSDFSSLYNHHLSNNGRNRVVVRRNGSSLPPSTRTNAQPPPFAALSKELYLRIFNYLDWKSVCMVSCSCSLWRYVCERSGKELLEQKGVRNILWLFYLLDKIDEQIEIVLLMEEEERKRLKKLEEQKREKYKNGVNAAKKKKKTKTKTKKPSKEEDRPNGKKKKKKKNNNKSDESESSDSESSDSGSCSDGGLTKKAKKRPKKTKKAKKDKKSAIEFDMFLRSGTRIEFLKATVMLLRTYFKQNGLLQKRKLVPMAEYTRLLGILDKQLLETHSVLAQVISGELPMNENFDIIELSLRRYYSDFTLMFSPHGGANTAYSHPSRIITDDKARKVWEESVGKDVYFCNFKSFYKHVLRQETDLADKDFKRYMKYFLNFPKDDTVSVAKWNTLTRLFGPYRKFYRTLHRYVIGTGFLGLINRIRAEEILKNYPNHVLIRFSRTAPLLLAFSENKDGVITHSTNGPSARKLLKLPETKDNVPIDIYLQKVFPRSSLIPMKVDGRLVARKDTYTDYVSTSSGYLCAGEFLWEND